MFEQTLAELLQMNALQAAWFLFTHGLWVPFLIIFLRFAWDYRLYTKQGKWLDTIEFTFLAIDIPRDNEQTPRAVEQMYATLAGAHMPLTKAEMLLEGKFQLSFSLEIVSIDGYLQYIVRTPVIFRDLVESAIYAQYPDAEITEVEDYAKDIPGFYPDDKYNVWGAELVPSNKDFYPIKTYPEFEDQISGEFKDPMSSVLETMSKLKPGEQFWLQIILIPTGFDWPKKANKFALKLAGKKISEKRKGILSNLMGPIYDFVTDWILNYSTLFNQGENSASNKNNDMPSMMLHLTPGERAAIEAVEKKASKIIFEVKMRMVYVATKDVFQSQSRVAAVMGAIKQFNYNDLNGLRPDQRTKTSAYYGFASRKKNLRRGRIIRNYKARTAWGGRLPWHLNIEELATLYHFPILTVKAPMLERLETKKSEAPAYLASNVEQAETDQEEDFKHQLDALNIHNDYYERKYAVDKSKLKPRDNNKETESSEENIPSNLPIA